VNHLFVLLGVESWKPVLATLLLPPLPFLLAILVGARLMLPRRGWGWAVITLSVAALWLTSTTAAGRWLEQFVLQVPSPLRNDRIGAIRADVKAKGGGSAIVVLGGGMEPLAPEYGVSSLHHYSLERLRYGLWLGQQTGLPVAFSGGMGWAQTPGASEAETAARIAALEFNRPLRWTEGESHDTHENAMRTVPLLKRAGIDHIVLVTHGWHMPRARHNFEEAARSTGITIEAAPMGLAQRTETPVLDWLPSIRGFTRVRNALHEALGRLMGA
jgi:uncharacterized SAM-binding protein YcdF (DUF218 family)